ncbi:hypothetical protein A2U01_0100329, partial [Trifolium medium]|nr:hypothetical protein [Trifolium medium]
KPYGGGLVVNAVVNAGPPAAGTAADGGFHDGNREVSDN